MKILKRTKKNQATKKLSCEFCEAEFVKETSLVKHICERKRRYQDKNLVANRIAFQAFLQFYQKNISRKPKTYEDFIKSSYYTAFVKLGNYCLSADVLNVSRYVDWLLKEKVSIDSWTKDSNYTKYIIDYCKMEDPLDAIARSIETTVRLAAQDKIQTKDVFRYGNQNKICFEITKGKISPWMLYQSDSGVNFLEKLDVTQQRMIIDYINPEQWAIKFNKHKTMLTEVKELLRAGGY